jgi:hypothetical protein
MITIINSNEEGKDIITHSLWYVYYIRVKTSMRVYPNVSGLSR